MENPAPKDASMASVEVPPGSSQDRGMCEEKRTNDRPEEGGTLNSGGPDPIRRRRSTSSGLNDFQPQEGIRRRRDTGVRPAHSSQRR